MACAEKNFLNGYNCAQSVAVAYAPLCGLDARTAAAAVHGFGGGFGRMREVCGTVCGGIFVLNMMFADEDDSPQKNARTMHAYSSSCVCLKHKRVVICVVYCWASVDRNRLFRKHVPSHIIKNAHVLHFARQLRDWCGIYLKKKTNYNQPPLLRRNDVSSCFLVGYFLFNSVFFGAGQKTNENKKNRLTNFLRCDIILFTDENTKYPINQRSGCGAVGSALPWGGRGRGFKSRHSDQIKKTDHKICLFYFI